MARLFYCCIFILTFLPHVAMAATDAAINPLPTNEELDDGVKVRIGRTLFFSNYFNKEGSQSCATCHQFKSGGTSNQVLKQQSKDGDISMNIASVFNVKYKYLFFNDGRTNNLKSALELHLEMPYILDKDWNMATSKISQDDELSGLFKAEYDNGINKENIVDALHDYLLTLNTPNSRFDRFLRGNVSALTSQEVEGYQLFQSFGCIACHQGINIGSNLVQNFGLYKRYQNYKPDFNDYDLGHYNVSQNPTDKHAFRVPSLRNVVLTAPYFHDGSAKTLEEAVNVMALYQTGQALSSKEADLIIKFLDTLTGEAPRK